jgi:hypothetical protein
MKNSKVILVALVLVAFTYGFISSQTEKKEVNTSYGELIQEFAKEGIIVEDFYVTTGEEVRKAFNSTVVPDEAQVIFVIYRTSSNESDEEYMKGHVKVIYGILDAYPAIDGVLVWDATYSSFTDIAMIIYAEKNLALKIRNTTKSYEELLNNFQLIEFSSNRFINEGM